MNTIEKNSKVKQPGRKRKSSESADVKKNDIKKPKDKDLNKSGNENIIIDNINKENHNLDDNSNLEYYEKQVDYLQKVLSAKYFDVIERLKLDFIPNCVHDMVFCKNHHSKNCPAPSVIADNITCRIKHFLTEKRPLNYLKICNSMMQQRIILNEDILNGIFQLIIAHKCEDEIEHYTNDYVVNESKMTLINFINLFPPCWKNIRNIYFNICTKPIDSSKYLPTDINSIEQRNLFLFILNMIEITIYEKEEDNITISKNNSMDNSTAESDMLFNFKEWETKNYKDYKMNAYNRGEKLSRLFLCLDIFVKIFEVDLSLWILRYLSKPYKHLFTNDIPLIMSAMLFKEFNPISDFVLKVVNLFTILIINNFSHVEKHIFERLLSLLCVVMNVLDIKDDIKYPNLEMNTINFGKKIFESFEATSEISFDNFIKVLEHIKIPYIRLIVIDQLLKKLDRDSSDEYLTPRKIYETFGKLNWAKYKRSMNKMNIINGKILQENIPNIESLKYPKIDINNKFKSKILEFYREEYLHLHLEALKAFCDTFYTKSFLLILMDSCKPESSITLLKEFKKTKLDNKKFNLEKLEKDASKMLLKINLNDDFEKEILKEVPEYDGVCVNSDIILKYREDFKYLSLFKKNLPVMIKKFGNEFEIFTEFIDFCFTP